LSIRALIVDDEEPARGELRYLLAAHPEVEVVGEAATASEALDRVLEPGVGEGDGAGLGLANVHQRLTTFYGEGVRLKSGGFGTVVRLYVPAE
jgi:DNA-binding LytR/AlgR family response regulator